jgi:pyrroloquinoline quinone (PQQ) biosynthesis protein C
LIIGLESQPPEIYPPLVASFPKHYGWSLNDPAVRFFAGHVEADTVHGARGFKLTPCGRTRALDRRTPSCSHDILDSPPWA